MGRPSYKKIALPCPKDRLVSSSRELIQSGQKIYGPINDESLKAIKPFIQMLKIYKTPEDSERT